MASARLVVLLFFELSSRSSAHVELALQAMTRGRYAGRFWILGVGVGMVLPLVLAVVVLAGLDDPTNPAGRSSARSAGAVVGLYGYEDAFVRAGQAVPLS